MGMTNAQFLPEIGITPAKYPQIGDYICKMG
jgi:hypothetical protein